MQKKNTYEEKSFYAKTDHTYEKKCFCFFQSLGKACSRNIICSMSTSSCKSHRTCDACHTFAMPLEAWARIERREKSWNCILPIARLNKTSNFVLVNLRCLSIRIGLVFVFVLISDCYCRSPVGTTPFDTGECANHTASCITPLSIPSL